MTKVTRRDFAGLCIGAAATTTVLVGQIGATDASSTSPPTTVDQNPIRRRGTGLRALDVSRASPGFTLFSSAGDPTVYMIDLRGSVVHTWKMPYPPGLYGYLTESGTLFYNGQIHNDSFLGKVPSKGGAALETTWDGKVLWEVRHKDHHHDGRLLRNGNVILLCAAELPATVAKKVQGGRAGTEEHGRIFGDYLVELSKSGDVIWEWRAWEHLDPEKDVITALQDNRSEWTHGNAVIELADGDLLVSFRNISTIVKIRRQDGEIVWRLGAPPLSGQHAPTPLPNGNILLFDNGPHRLDQSFPYSRVIEIDPATDQIVWKYQEANQYNFYSPRISNAQRLLNGNTLINEGFFGRFFEVTGEGDVVWEYVNPHFGPASEPPKTQRNHVFRAYRYTEAEIKRARQYAS